MGGDESGALVSLLLLVMSDFVTPMDCSPPGSSVHGILQARAPEWGAIAFSPGPLRLQYLLRVQFLHFPRSSR